MGRASGSSLVTPGASAPTEAVLSPTALLPQPACTAVRASSRPAPTTFVVRSIGPLLDAGGRAAAASIIGAPIVPLRDRTMADLACDAINLAPWLPVFHRRASSWLRC